MEKRSNEKIINLEIYTDGSCKKLGQTMTFGGWAFIAVRDSKMVYAAAGNERDTTNQRMELKAIFEGLKYAETIRRPNEKVIIYSDSAYAINCYLEGWYLAWDNNGWINSKGKKVANPDLWREIVPFFGNFWYDFRKVDGHSGVFWNEECDDMAQEQADMIKFGPKEL